MMNYLCGGINGLSDGDCNDWRSTAKQLLKGETLDPMRRDYRGIEAGSVNEIVRGDLRDIDECTGVLVNATRASWGTAMEIVYAHQRGLPIAAWVGDGRVSPWLTYHASHVSQTLEGAAAWLNRTTPAIPFEDRHQDCRVLCTCTVSEKPHCHYCRFGMESK